MKNNLNLVDLHIHTKYSDGTDDVDCLLKEINRQGITIFSVTDHDTVEFYRNLDYSKMGDVKIIPGIEFSCKTDVAKCHILGYGIDVNNLILQKTTDEAQKRRTKKLANRLKYLEVYHQIVFDDIIKTQLTKTPLVDKTHIAEQIVRMKKAKNISEAIEKFLTGIPEDADDKLDAKVAIDSIVAAGGVPVWAHPLGEGSQNLDKNAFEAQLNVLMEYGIKGLECYYSQYYDTEIRFLLRYAIENHLLISGGSDYHGKVKNIRLGKLLKRDLLLPNCIGRELTILQRLGIDNFDERFKNCTYFEMKYLCKSIWIFYRGKLLDDLKNGEGYFYRKCFNFYTKVFDNSSVFKKRCYDEIKKYDQESVYESENGLINIIVSDYDPFLCWGFTWDENDWEVVTAVSNYNDEFVNDIIKAHEEFYGVKIYNRRYESNSGKQCLVISDKEIFDDEWRDLIKR